MPANATDGVYIFALDDKGKEVYEKIADIDFPTQSKRDIPEVSITNIGKRYNWPPGSYVGCNDNNI